MGSAPSRPINETFARSRAVLLVENDWMSVLRSVFSQVFSRLTLNRPVLGARVARMGLNIAAILSFGRCGEVDVYSTQDLNWDEET